MFGELVGRIAGILPEAIHSGGFGSGSGRQLVALLVAAVIILVAQELVTAAHEVAKWSFYRRYEHYLLGRVMDATLGTQRLELFEDPRLSRLADRSVRLAGLEPGDLVDGWCTRWLNFFQGAAAAVLAGTVWPAAAGMLAIIWLVAGAVMGSTLRRLDIDLWFSGLSEAEYLSQIAERPAWAKEVRVFGLTSWLAERFGLRWAGALEQMARARRAGRRRTAAVLAVLLCSHGIVAAAMVVAGLSGRLSAAQITVLLLGMSGMTALADQTGGELIEYGSPHVPVVLDLENESAQAAASPPPQACAHPAPVPRPVQIAREIRFSGVDFAYPDSPPVYRQLNLTIKAGTSLGVVGLNGAGKTTLIKLLSGLEVPSAGTITVDGVPVSALDVSAWRRTIAAIFQDFVRYGLPARDNIAFGAIEVLQAASQDACGRAARDRLDALVNAAAERAGADGVIAALPYGLSTPLSRRFPGGVDLSGGQWQRIALARAMAAVENGARLLVLDEPTAQLDVRAEADLYERFLSLTRGLTTIIISHRFSTVRRADRIVVLDGGRITEDGSHDELIEAGGEYARLFSLQAASYQGIPPAGPRGGRAP